jgi:phosphoribosylformylglycinamidine cyclo-ligase
VASIVEGVAEGCRRAGCALLGGETAEHPGVMPDDQFDLAGFCVGVVDEADLLGPRRVAEGDALIGLASSGLHANGYSLVRQALLGPYALDETPPGLTRPLVEELLEPCTIHAPVVLRLAREGMVHAAAHITGGGITENLPRALPPGLGARVDLGSWPVPPVFGLLAEASGADEDDLYGTFNMGIGMILVVAAEDAAAVLEAAGPGAHRIGEVVPGSGVSRA